MKSRRLGFGIIEILVSLAISSLITLGLINQYLAMKQNYVQTQMRLEQSMELQVAAEFIRESIRRAGFTPCLRVDYLTGYDHRNKQYHLMPVELNPSDPSMISLNRMEESFYLIHEWVSLNQFLTHSSHFKKGQSVLIADCYHAEVHEISEIQQIGAKQQLTSAQAMLFNYQAPVYIGAWIEETFFIQVNSNKQPALFYQLHKTEELTPIIQSMDWQIEMNAPTILLHGQLTLHDKKTVPIDAMVRT